jgi:hypothetical protein
MSGITLDRLLFSRTDVANSPQLGAHLLGDSSAVITSHTVSSDEGLDVYLLNSSLAVTQSGTWSVQVTDGTDTLAIDASGNVGVNIQNASIVVTATALDIRALSHSTDSIKIGDGTDFISVNSDGSINVVSTEAAPNGATLASAVVVSNTAIPLPATALADRKYMDVQNLSDKAIAIGDSAVTFATGIIVPKGGNKEFEVGPSQILYARAAAAGTNDVRVFERAK